MLSKNKKYLYLAAVGLVVVIIGSFFYYCYCENRRQQFFVAFLNIGQGDGALIHFAGGVTMLVDCGPDRTVLSELGKQLPFWDRTIDILLATHPDRDHYGGCIDVLKNYKVNKIVTNGRGKPYDPEWQEWDRLVSASGAEVITMASPTVWTVAGDRLEFLSPNPAFRLDTRAADSNNYSIVFRLTHQNKKFLFTGDMEVPLEQAIMSKYCAGPSPCTAIKSEVLKVSHHGSPNGTSAAFAAAVHPITAVISVGPNRYGHPSERVIKRLERAGARVLRTDMEGAIVVE